MIRAAFPARSRLEDALCTILPEDSALRCRLGDHDRVYTDEYRNAEGHVQADSVCTRCGDAHLAWTGPTVQAVEEACSTRVPTKEEVYDEV